MSIYVYLMATVSIELNKMPFYRFNLNWNIFTFHTKTGTTCAFFFSFFPNLLSGIRVLAARCTYSKFFSVQEEVELDSKK